MADDGAFQWRCRRAKDSKGQQSPGSTLLASRRVRDSVHRTAKQLDGDSDYVHSLDSHFDIECEDGSTRVERPTQSCASPGEAWTVQRAERDETDDLAVCTDGNGCES